VFVVETVWVGISCSMGVAFEVWRELQSVYWSRFYYRRQFRRCVCIQCRMTNSHLRNQDHCFRVEFSDQIAPGNILFALNKTGDESCKRRDDNGIDIERDRE
jgi:hypothetical protein